MINNLLDFENKQIKKSNNNIICYDEDINDKYDKGYSRVITEMGSYKIAIVKDIFTQSNYNLHPEYQRRITWNDKKRSKLIESLIINIPIPPIFLYEYNYDKYEIMDGLQRITSILKFYQNEYKLVGLEEWSELNGKYYKDLPEKIKEGIDRRQLQVITLLKESASTDERAERIKRLVFERLNTGGVKLQGQEIRNAIYSGKGNEACFNLSRNKTFTKLWDIPTLNTSDFDESLDDYDTSELQTKIEEEKIRKKIERHSLYKRMYDVELVLRFFAMRHLDEFTYSLSHFLDDMLISLNDYSEEELKELSIIFEQTITKIYTTFGSFGFKFFSKGKWSSPSKMIYDPMMIVMSQKDINPSPNRSENTKKLREFYSININDEKMIFDGKHQSKDNIINRVELLDAFIRTL